MQDAKKCFPIVKIIELAKIVGAPVFLLVLVVLFRVICSFLSFLTRKIQYQLAVRQRAGTASFPADYLFKGSSSPSDYLFLVVICSNHCKGVRSLVVACQAHFVQSD